MNIDHIKLFLAVYREGSFAAVAKEMNVAASSVSRTISSLEEQLQTRLFQRNTRNLTATQAGEHFYHRVAVLTDEFELVQQEVMEQSSEPHGKLRVTASTSFGQQVIAPLLAGFHARYPKIELELLLSDTPANMLSEQIDVALRHGKLDDSRLVARKLLDVSYLLVASPEYLAASPTLHKPSDVQSHSLINFNYKQFEKAWHFRQGDKKESVPIKPVLTMTTALAIKECVQSGMGIALLADWTAQQAIKERKLVHVLPNWEVAGRHMDSAVWLVYPSRAFVPTKTRVFTDYLLNELKGPSP